jgi:methionine-rich copper-binding protein CopC
MHLWNKIVRSIGAVFGHKRDHEKPLLLRIASASADQCNAVELETRWEPSGVQVRTPAWLVRGVCILPWRVNQDRVTVKVELSANGRLEEGFVEASVSDPRHGSVRDVQMAAAA